VRRRPQGLQELRLGDAALASGNPDLAEDAERARPGDKSIAGDRLLETAGEDVGHRAVELRSERVQVLVQLGVHSVRHRERLGQEDPEAGMASQGQGAKVANVLTQGFVRLLVALLGDERGAEVAQQALGCKLDRPVRAGGEIDRVGRETRVRGRIALLNEHTVDRDPCPALTVRVVSRVGHSFSLSHAKPSRTAPCSTAQK
jgi:hypothetical protein